MGRGILNRLRAAASGTTAGGPRPRRGAAPARCWPDTAVDQARQQGAFPYVVEGFAEVSEAVRRGHAVMLRRETCTVAEGITVFSERSSAGAAGFAAATDQDLVTVSKFEVRTARFLVNDPYSATGSIELTPKRLQRYLLDDQRAVGVALGC